MFQSSMSHLAPPEPPAPTRSNDLTKKPLSDRIEPVLSLTATVLGDTRESGQRLLLAHLPESIRGQVAMPMSSTVSGRETLSKTILLMPDES